MRKIKKIIVHCSDSDIPKHDNVGIIRGWHLARGFNDVGYHRFYQKSGIMQLGRPIDKTGAHCKGLNEESLGYCLGGRVEFTHNQYRALAAQIEKDKQQYKLTNKDVLGHYETPSGKDQGKTCPNIDMVKFRKVWLKPDTIAKKKRDDTKGSTGSVQGTKQRSKAGSKTAARSSKSAAEDTGKK